MYYIGIDLGGTNIKAGVCDENGKILIKDSVKTHVEKGLEYVVDTMSGLALDLVKRQGLTVDDIEYIGVATPGTADDSTGVIVYCSSIPFRAYPLAEKMSEKTGIKIVHIENDANAAAKGEATVGSAKGYNSSLLITLGTGVGGGTLLGLGSKLLDVRNYESIVEMALKGDLDKVDLYVGELSKTEDGYMPSKVTAANFGKVTDFSTKEDIAAGLVNMVFQTVGMMSVFAAQTVGLKDIVLIGNLSKFPNIRELCKQVEDLHDVHFHVPEFSEYATAYGAALSNR